MDRKKKSGITIAFIAFQIFLIFFYIHHQSRLIRYSYQQQKLEKKRVDLLNKKRELTHALHASYNLSKIKDFAVQANMQKITLNQVKTVPHESSAT